MSLVIRLLGLLAARRNRKADHCAVFRAFAGSLARLAGRASPVPAIRQPAPCCGATIPASPRRSL